MGIFYLISAFLLLGAFIKPKWQDIYIYMSFIILFILSAFRAVSVGTDTSGYETLFNRLKNGTSIRQEVGWQLLNKIVIYFNGNFEHLLIASTLFVLLPVFYVVRKYSCNPMLSLFLYFSLYIYLQSFNITRQSIAVSFIFLSMPFLLNNRRYLFCIFILLASIFHITALLCLPLVFIDKIPDKNLVYIILILGSLFVGTFLSDIILQTAANLFGYGSYLMKLESGTQTGLFLLAVNAFSLFVLATAKDRGTLFKLFFVYVVFANLIVRIPYSYRIIFYFSIIQVLYLPLFIESNKIRAKPMVFMLVIIYAYLVFSRSAGSGEITPYINTLF